MSDFEAPRRRTAAGSDPPPEDVREALRKWVARGNSLDSLGLSDRYEYATILLAGYTSVDDAAWLMLLFESAPPADRRRLYRHIESREWDGNLRHGRWVDDDSLWNALDDDQIVRLRALLDQP